MNDFTPAAGAYVDAAAPLLGFDLDAQRRAAVMPIVARLAAFAGDIAALPLPDTVEIAGEFTP